MQDNVTLRAEFEVLACVLAGQAKICLGNCKSDDFDSITIRNAMKAAKSLLSSGGDITIATLCDEVTKLGLLTPDIFVDIETAASLEGLLNPEACSKLVREQSARRQLADEYMAVASSLRSGKLSSYEAAGRVMGKTLRIAIPEGKRSMGFDEAVKLADIKHQQIKGGEVVGYKTYIDKIDKRMMGIQKGEFVVIQGASNASKTGLLLQILLKNALEGDAKCALYTMEMQASAIVDRCICMMSKKFDNPSLLRGYLGGSKRISSDEWAEIESIKTRLSKDLADKFYIDDSKNNLYSIFADIEHRITENEFDDDWIIGIDYIQIAQADVDEDFANIKKVTDMLKRLAHEKGIPILGISSMDKASANAINRGEKVKGGGYGSNSLSYNPDIILRIKMDDPSIGCDCERIPEWDPRTIGVELGLICSVCRQPVTNIAEGEIYVEKGRNCGKGYSTQIVQDMQHLRIIERDKFFKRK